jgi:thiamine biosynthesis protein ThiS
MEMKRDLMSIVINGNPHEIAAPMMVAGLLEKLGLEAKPVVVELNEVAVFPRDYAHTPVPEGARVEVVTLAAGG